MSINLRPVVAEDEQFLFEVYASTRLDEVAAWGWDAAQQDAFLRMQFIAQRRSYEMQYPQMDHHVILRDEQPVGRLLVARSSQEIRLVDIALLPTHRNQGIGTALIKPLLDEGAAAGLPVGLQVLRDNPAALLYERLGFVRISESAIYLEMEWRAA